LIKPEYDQWAPGEHNGTFRGNNLAFVAATEALSFWKNEGFEAELKAKSEMIRMGLERITLKHPETQMEIKGRGMIQGIAFKRTELAGKLCAIAFEKGIIMETSGPNEEVAKLMPPLTIDQKILAKGLAVVEAAFTELLELETPSVKVIV
jgi:diaminobutyrate-2-oxoglutarate transaminase